MLNAGDDKAIMTAIAGGNREALGVLYDRYAGLLLAVGVKIVGERREAEDVLHDVFLEVWQKAGTYSATRGSVRTWLLVRMRSRSLDRCRAVRVTRSTSLDDAPERSAPALASEIIDSPDRNRLRAALTSLSEAQRQVLELAYFRGLSSREIGEQIGVPTGTVKSRLRTAIAKLRSGLRVGEEAPA